MMLVVVSHSEDDDVFDGGTATPTYQQSMDTETSASTDSAADIDRSRYHHRHGWNADAVRAGQAIEDDLRSAATDDGEDHRPSTRVSVPVDSERRKSGFQRRRLGQLQLKHRLAVDLPEQSSPGTHQDESDFITDYMYQAASVFGRPSNFAPGEQNELVLNFLWNTLDDSDCQFYVVFVVALATLAVALNVSPFWLILVVVSLSMLHFCIDERRRAEPR